MKKGKVNTTVYVYGDSYADIAHNDRPLKYETWIKMLTKKFPNTVSYALAGTGPENQLLKLQKNIKSYPKGGILIFFVSDPLRFSLFDFYKKPSNEFVLSSGTWDELDYLAKHQKMFLKQIILHYYTPELHALRYAYIYSTLFALHEYFDKILIWPCFNTDYYQDPLIGMEKFLSKPNNVTVASVDLCKISIAEFINEAELRKSGKFITWDDTRTNHLCAPNHEILFNEITEWILNPSQDWINTNKFKKGIMRL